MFCKNCGKEMKDGDAFCRECGEKNESLSAQNNVVPDSSGGSVTVKKRSKGKLIIIAAFVVLIIVVIACAVGGSNAGGENAIIENNDCQLGATYAMTPSQYIDRFNSVVSEFGGDSSLYLPSINEWTAADLLEDGNITYMYAVSNELIYWIYTYQDDKVTLVTSTLGDNLIGNGVLYMTIMECAALNIDDKDIAYSMYELFNEKIREGHGVYGYKNSIVTVSGNDIRIAAVSNEVLDTMEYYSISDSELE